MSGEAGQEDCGVRNHRTWIKICGLTSIQEAEWVNEVQADFAGMVLFFPKSKRNITTKQAEGILQALNGQIGKVAVVVSPSPQQIRELQSLPFDYIQVHGEIARESLERLRKQPFLRAFNGDNMKEYKMYEKITSCAGFVFDAAEPGSGRPFDWNMIPQMPASDKFYLLAGGLTPENVGEAVARIHPDGVDVSSGVETESGTGKDLRKIKAFVDAVRHEK